eukprot:SAG11_NODE_6993_length_1211_cov_0.686433_1_plen_46_part_10
MESLVDASKATSIPTTTTGRTIAQRTLARLEVQKKKKSSVSAWHGG